ncbi:hypothetical protein ACIQUM_36470 [Amycolatopsis azurea]|uniref:hypothetical protein n=1 Tax=Amycolatopsis azurea TaxID=36819 RepID=UPI003826921C
MSSTVFARRTVATLFLGAVITGAGVAAAGTALADTPATAPSPASYLHSVGTSGAAPDGTRITGVSPDGTRITWSVSPDSREL